jgi:hypothetical protein
MKYFKLLTLLILTSCIDVGYEIEDDRLIPYVEKYKEYAYLRGVDDKLNSKEVIFNVKKLDMKIWAQARHRSSRKVEISVNKDWMDFHLRNGNDHIIEVLIIHEIGHAVWGYKHDVNIIMQESQLKFNIWHDKKDQLLNDFFNAEL